MKVGKEVKIDNYEDYNVVFGSVNDKHTQAIYINISAWAEPKINADINYNRVIKEINKNLKQTLFDSFNLNIDTEFVKDKTIVDLDIRESGIKYGKRSFMCNEITLFLKNETQLSDIRMRPNLDKVIGLVINSIFKDNKSFKFHKKKK